MRLKFKLSYEECLLHHWSDKLSQCSLSMLNSEQFIGYPSTAEHSSSKISIEM